MTDQPPPAGPPPLPQLQLVADPTKFVGATIKKQRIHNDNYNSYHSAIVGEGEVVLGMMVTNVPGTNYNQRTGQSEIVYSPELVFVVARHPDAALQQALQDAKASAGREEYAQTNLHKAREEASDLKEQVEALTKQLAEKEAARSDLVKMRHQLEEKVRRMEGDLAKVRSHFGDKGFKEATGT